MLNSNNSPKRLILKVSGELFSSRGKNIDFQKYNKFAKQILKIVKSTEIQLAMVVGGGNIFRGREKSEDVDAAEADSMGMLATVMNGIALREALIRQGATDTRLMTAFHLPEFAEPYIRLKAKHHLNNNRLVILAGGLGKPSFSTDSAVAQYANELNCSLVLKASTVDGVYDTDPKKNQKAKKLPTITFQDALEKRLKVMDSTAFAMCMISEIPIFVFDIRDLDRIPDIVNEDFSFGSLIS
ncbi:MAG TPA: uridine monophosphate kinase [Candidatus Saccharimonadales bacterium]|nr:uridine monophosphate kinase [Candidatus Saccharimonadales bacterium]